MTEKSRLEVIQEPLKLATYTIEKMLQVFGFVEEVDPKDRGYVYQLAEQERKHLSFEEYAVMNDLRYIRQRLKRLQP